MSKYEIMLILDPNSDEKIISEIANSTFQSKDFKIEKLERTELAYEINKSKTANYYLITVEATGEENNEFIRKANISKNIWRSLSINLDLEKGLNRKAKPKRMKRYFVKKGTNNTNNNANNQKESTNKIEKNSASNDKEEINTTENISS